MSLKDRLKAEIAEDGPISVAEFMSRCLHDPKDGYYATRPALGEMGDFVTAPLVSQMFGELIGLWAVETWVRLGKPEPFSLVEMGPGDGTLMDDALRAARLSPEFLTAARLYLLEPSKPLQARQRERLAKAPLQPVYIDGLAEIASEPFILVANEVLDCLPARQFVRTERGWRERHVGLDEGGELGFGLAPDHAPDGLPANVEVDSVWEMSPQQAALGAEIGALIDRCGGCALLIDYGRDAPEPGDTLQALKAHRKLDPLACPGEADLTVWADFPRFRRAAQDAGAHTALLPQGTFLQRLGVEARAQALSRARPELSEVIGRQLGRLVDAEQMGTLYKACAIFPEGFVPPGFEDVP